MRDETRNDDTTIGGADTHDDTEPQDGPGTDGPARVHRRTTVGLPPDEVWELLVDDDERDTWFGGRSTLDPVPGGRGTFDDGTRREAVVEQAVPGRRLQWRWWEEGDDGAGQRVRFDLSPSPDGTDVDVTEVPLAPHPGHTARLSAGSSPGLTDVLGPLLDLELRCLVRSTVVAGRR